MIAYKFDGTKDGLLCCLFESFTEKEKPFMVTSGTIQMGFDIVVKTVQTDAQNATRVRNGIVKYGSIALLNKLFFAFRSGDELKETIIFNVAYKCLDKRCNYITNFADNDVILFYELYKAITYEAHRFKGFIRFQESVDGILYSHIEPDNDICDLVANHFLKRLGTKFMIYDSKRNKASVCNGKAIYTGTVNAPFAVLLSPKEVALEGLWRTYYNSVNIKQRKNFKLMNGYLPRRYHKNLPEKSMRGRVFGEIRP